MTLNVSNGNNSGLPFSLFHSCHFNTIGIFPLYTVAWHHGKQLSVTSAALGQNFFLSIYNLAPGVT
jgi:hypothetical protein